MNSDKYIRLMMMDTQSAHLMNFYPELRDLEGLLVDGMEDEWHALFDFAGHNVPWYNRVFGRPPEISFLIDLYHMCKDRDRIERESDEPKWREY